MEDSAAECRRAIAALTRSVAVLAHALPPEAAPPEPPCTGYVYGPDAGEDLGRYRRWLTWDARRRAPADVVLRRRRTELANLPEVALVPLAEADSSLADFVGVIGAGDVVDASALNEIVVTLAEHPEIDVLYTDEDLVEANGQRSGPAFKPDWSPELLLSSPYVGRLMIVRRTLAEAVGGWTAGPAGAEEYDLALRATEGARQVFHLPRIACSRRAETLATRDSRAARGPATTAVQAALRRRGDVGEVGPGLIPGTVRVQRQILGEPLVSVVIPFQDGAELLRRAIEGLRSKAGYERFEVLLVDNLSWEPGTKALLARFVKDERFRVVPYPEVFNWARLNNFAVRQAAGDHVLFLNADVAGRSDGWLAAMLEHSQRPEVGAVGARLLYPDGRVQHAGVVLGLGEGVAWHAGCFCPGDRPGYLGHTKVVRDVSAVTGACLMVRRDVFDQLGGFDETLAVAYNDVDFCLRARERGYRVLYTPLAELVHAESAWRGGIAPEGAAIEAMRHRWGASASDPFFNPNLDRRRAEFALPPV